MNILILVDDFCPIPKANALCIVRLANEFKRLGNKVTILTSVREPVKEILSEEIDIFYFKKMNWNSCKTNKMKINYVIDRFKTLLKYPRINNEKVLKYYSKGKDIIIKKNIDVVITVCNPPEAVEAGTKMKKSFPKLKYIIYNLDSISNCSLGKIDKKISFFLFRKAKKWELNQFKFADLIIHLENHRQHFSSKIYNIFEEKTIYQYVPLLEKNIENVSKIHLEIKKISVLYAGRFYRHLRDPDIIIKDFINTNINLYIFTTSDYAEMLRNTYKDNNNIIIKDYVSEKKLKSYINKMDALISLGNKESEMFPSKIVSYISTGKPIIHIYQSENDPIIKFLEFYQNSLVINCKENNTDKIKAFLKNDLKKVSLDEIYANYYRNTPEYNVDMIINFLGGKNE